MNNFQTILVAIFLAFFVFAVLIFSGLLKIGGKSNSSATVSGKVVIWGTFKNPDIYKVFDDTRNGNQDLTITYTAKNESSYEQDLLQAFALGKGPDLFFITPEMVQKDSDFIYKIPFASYQQKTFQDAFIDGATVYLANDGVIAFPIAVDPMVMYYNKDIISNAGLAKIPDYWDELFDLAPQLTKKKDDGTILQSMIALGRFDNVTHAKDILATLLIQNGNPIVQATATGYTPVLTGGTSTSSISPTESVLNFYTEFTSPTVEAYSWNRALKNSVDMFTGGKLAFYLGRASELFKIQSINPNLSFDVSAMLQTRGSKAKRTYARIYALAVNKKSANLTTAFSVAGLLTTGDSAKNFAAAVSLPPALRSLLSTKPTDPYLFTFWSSAIIARTWLDPDTKGSDAVFGELIDNLLSNKLSLDDAISKAQTQLEFLSKK